MQEIRTLQAQEANCDLEMQKIEQKSPILNIFSPHHRSALKKILISFLVAQTMFYTSFTPGTEPETRMVEIPKEIRNMTHISQTHIEIKFKGREPVIGIGNIAEADHEQYTENADAGANTGTSTGAQSGGNTAGNGGGTAGMWQSAAMSMAMGLIGGIPIGHNVKYTFSSSGSVQAYVICNTSNTDPEVGSDGKLTCICHTVGGGSCVPPVQSKTVQYTEGGNKSEEFDFATWRPCGTNGAICWGAAKASINSVVYDGSTSLAYDFGTGGSTWGDGGGVDGSLDGGYSSGSFSDGSYYDSGYGDGGFYDTGSMNSNDPSNGSSYSSYDPSSGGITGGQNGDGGFYGIDPSNSGSTEGGISGGYDGFTPTDVSGGIDGGYTDGSGGYSDSSNTNGSGGYSDGGYANGSGGYSDGSYTNGSGGYSDGGYMNGLGGYDDGSYTGGSGGYSGGGYNGGTGGYDSSDSGIISDGGNIKTNTGSSSYGGGINDILNDKGSSFNASDEDWANSNTGFGDIGDYLDAAFLDEDIPHDMTNNLLGFEEDFLNSIADILNNGEFDADGNPIGEFNEGGIYDEDGNYIGDGLGSDGYYDEYGNYIGPGGYDEDGNFVGPGGMYDEDGNYVGPGGYDADGNFVGEGGLYDADGNYVGPGGYDEYGNFVGEGGMFDANGNYIGIGGYDKDGNFVGPGGMYDKYGNYVGSGDGSFNANPDNPFAMLQSMLGMNGANSNDGNNNSIFGNTADSSLLNSNPLLKSIFGDDEKEIARNTASNQELFEKAFKFLKSLGLSTEDILKGRTYDSNSAWTDPKEAWDFNRITTLLRRHQVKINEKTGGAQAAAPRMPRPKMSDVMNGGQAAVPNQSSQTQQQPPRQQAREASGVTNQSNPNVRTVAP